VSGDLEIARREQVMKSIKRPMINDALRLLRLYLGLSQKELAAQLDLSQSMISELENGSKTVSIEVLEKYSNKLEIPMSKLLFFAEELDGEPVKTRGKLIIANRALQLLEMLSPRDLSNAS
jgi:transcriptional regulator with XRE-family HTH domain